MFTRIASLASVTATGALIALSLSVSVQAAELANGKAAPDFTLMDSTGKKHTLAENQGKTVVLEWTNYECPFVRKHYDSKNMQTLQANAKTDGVVWMSIISSKKGKEGYMEPKALDAQVKKEGSNAAAVLIDGDSKVGQMYGAKTTPHLFVIDPKGVLVYQGAIDNMPSTDIEDIKNPKTKNYVTQALGDLKAGRAIAEAKTKSYGCSVKY